jgi:two-component system LytT family sensor kinase
MKTRYLNTFPPFQNLTFWHFHCAGWLAFWCGDVIIILLQKIPPAEIISQAMDAPLGFLIGIVLRQVYIRVEYKKLSIIALLALVVFWSMVFTILWHVVMTTTRYNFMGPQVILTMANIKYEIPWLSQTVTIWFGWSSLYFGIKYWRDWDAEKKRSQEAVSLAHRAQLQMLRYQVNPHFLFNALNSVRALVDEDKKNAKGMITELSEFLRYSLVTRDHTEVTLENELEAIRHYLSIEKKRFEDKLDVIFEVDPKAQEHPILSFLIHPFVENAIKYGMKTSPMPLRIRIHASTMENRLRIVISNTGTWLNANSEIERKSNGTGTGLENVRARLENAYPNRYHLETKELDGWVQAILEIHSVPLER